MFRLFHFFPITILHLSYDLAEMRKQRKMGHITIIGASLGIVEARMKSMLNEESFDGQTAGQLCGHCLFSIASDAILI